MPTPRTRSPAAAESPARGARSRPVAPDSWAAIKKTLRTWDQPRLLGLVRDLFTTVPDARAAVVGRLTLDKPSGAKGATLDALRRQVRRAVRPSRNVWEDVPDMRGARRVADQYLRATTDADGAIALYIEMVEAAMELSFALGWDESGFYDSIDRAAHAAQKHLPRASDAAQLSTLAGRVRTLLAHDNFPGWGMDEVIESLAAALEARAASLARGA